jgi:hypothetical protein
MPFRPKDMQECVDRYGKLQKAPDGRYYWPAEITWVKSCKIPEGIQKHLVNALSRQPVERIFCNTDMHGPLLQAFDNILTAGCEAELKTYDGCYNVRMARGSQSVFSLHSYAIAIDLNARDNPLGGRSSWSDVFVRCFTDAGFIWGGDFTRKDPMHFQWCGIPKQVVKLAS